MSEEPPTSPEASVEPLSEPGQDEVLDRHSKMFAKLVSDDFNAKLKPILAHIHNEDTNRGELLRVLVELKGELGLLAAELKAGRLDNIAIRAAINTLSDRVDKHGDRLDTLERK